MVAPKGGKMKLKTLNFLVYLAFAALFVQNASAMPVWFDFEDVQDPGDAEQIEAYMENIYGSDITVIGCVLGTNTAQLDSYVLPTAELQTQSFSFSFEQVPITAVSFDWLTAADSMHVYADGVEFFTKNPDCYAGCSGFIHFDEPVKTLVFDGSSAALIIDNLVVTNPLQNTHQIRNTYSEPYPHTPEPATALLLGIGGAMMLATRKRKIKNIKISEQKVR